MDSGRTARACLILAFSASLAGCVSSSGMKVTAINTLEGAYEAPKSTALPNDIQAILAEGGLNVSDPSAPTTETRMAEMATSKSSSGKVDRLVASLEMDSPGPVQVAAAPQPAKDSKLSLAATPAPGAGAVALASVEAPRQSVTFAYPEIGVVEQRHEPSVAAAAMAAPRKRVTAPKPAPVPAAAAAQKKTRRF